MDQAELLSMIPPKQQNPLLKRKPLQLGTSFISLSNFSPIQLQSPLHTYQTTLIYFYSGWCNISKSFTKKLSQYYEQINLEDKKMEIIGVSIDKNQEEYENINTNRPWIGLGLADSRIQGLREFYNIKAIPTLILLDKNGQEVARDCRQDLYNLTEDQAYEKWKALKQHQDSLY